MHSNNSGNIHADMQTGSTNANGCNSPPRTQNLLATYTPQERTNVNTRTQSINSDYSNTKHKKKVTSIFGNAFSKFACRGEKVDKSLKNAVNSGENAIAPEALEDHNNSQSHPHHKEKGGISMLVPHLHMHKADNNSNSNHNNVHTTLGGGGIGEKKTQELLKMLDVAKIESGNIIKNAQKQRDLLSQRAKKEAQNETKAVRDAVEMEFKMAEETGEIETAKVIEETTMLMNQQAEEITKIDPNVLNNAVQFVTNMVVTVDLSLLPTAIETITRAHNLSLLRKKRRQENSERTANSLYKNESSSSRDDAYAYIMGGRMSIEENDFLLDLSQDEAVEKKGQLNGNNFLRSSCWR